MNSLNPKIKNESQLFKDILARSRQWGAWCFVILLASWSLNSGSAFADPSSTNYGIASDVMSGGGGDIESTSYAVAEGLIDEFGKPLMTSTSYKVDGKIGIQGTAALPEIDSITPDDFKKFYSDESASYTVSATDPDEDTLQYKALQDDTVKDGPQTSNELTWSLGTGDLGRRSIGLEVIDPDDGTISKTQSAYVLRRPVK